MVKYLMIFSLFVVAVSCGDDTSGNATKPKEVKVLRTSKEAFSEKLESEELQILKELGLCAYESNDAAKEDCSPCTEEYFTIRKFRSDKPMKDAFLLQIRAGAKIAGDNIPFPGRRVLVFEREQGKLARTNAFVADFGEFEANSNNAVDNLLLVFYDAENDVLFHCMFDWNGSKYEFKEVESIDIGPGPKRVKPDIQKEVNNEVYGILVDQRMIF